jgi:hypothetical protein
MTSLELEEAVYASKFRRWHESSSVRTKPRRMLDLPDATALYFPPEELPFLDHPLVRARGPDVVSELLVQRLHVYLDFTSELEQQVVNPVCASISRRRSGLDLPHGMVQDAYKIYTDEAWHAQFSDDMQRQVVERTGIAPVLPQRPAFIRRLADAEARAPEAAKGLGLLFFAIVSETLISAILTDIPRDPRIEPAVRELVADHAADERIHHAYFARLLAEAWRQLGARQRRAIGPQLPELIRAFLDPDYAALAGILRTLGLRTDEVGQILAECLDERILARRARGHARHTLRHLARVGVLDDPATVEALHDAGLCA